MLGAIRADKKTIHLVNEDTYMIGTLLSDNQMEICAKETSGETTATTRFILWRQ